MFDIILTIIDLGRGFLMEFYIMPNLSPIIMQLLSLVVIGAMIYLFFLLVKSLRIYIKKNS